MAKKQVWLPENMPKAEALRFMPTAEIVGLWLSIQGAGVGGDYMMAVRNVMVDRVDSAAQRANQYIDLDEGPRA